MAETTTLIRRPAMTTPGKLELGCGWNEREDWDAVRQTVRVLVIPRLIEWNLALGARVADASTRPVGVPSFGKSRRVGKTLLWKPRRERAPLGV